MDRKKKSELKEGSEDLLAKFKIGRSLEKDRGKIEKRKKKSSETLG